MLLLRKRTFKKYSAKQHFDQRIDRYIAKQKFDKCYEMIGTIVTF